MMPSPLNSSRAALLLILAPIAASLGGCAPTPAAVQGNVTLDGKPLDQAAIQFVSLAGDRPKTGAAIRQGKYELSAIDGLLPGEIPHRDHRPTANHAQHRSASIVSFPLCPQLTAQAPARSPTVRGTFDFELKSTR